MVAFDRPTGAPADVQELEYVSALHQTSKIPRPDGSIDATDILLYLRSRFGLELTAEQVTATILQGMGGSADDGEVVDLMELQAALLIPHLLKCAKVQLSQSTGAGAALPEGCLSPTDSTAIAQVWEMIIHDCQQASQEDSEALEGDETTAPKISAALIQRLLNAYGEHDLAENDDLVQKMLQALEGHDRLTPDAFAQALTQDVQLYDLTHESTYANTYQDIMEDDDNENVDKDKDKNKIILDVGDNYSSFMDEYKNSDEVMVADEETSLLMDKKKDVPAFKTEIRKKYSAPAIDSTTGTYRSKSLIVVLWASTLFSYLSFNAQTGESGNDIDCPPFIPDGTWEDNSDVMTCNIYSSISQWLWAFFVLCLFGMVYIGCGSCGNADGNKYSWKPLWAIFFLFCCVIIPNVTVEGEDIDGSERYIRLVSILLASTACFLHLQHVLYLWSCTKGCKQPLNRIVNNDEYSLKQSMAYKMDQVVNNALEIHHTPDEQNILTSCFGYGLHVFSKWKNTERVGGNFWVWSNTWNREKTIASKEGVWYSARLSAANLSQYIVVFYLMFYFIHIHYTVMEKFDKENNRAWLHEKLQYLIDTHVSEERVAYISGQISNAINSFLTRLMESGIVNFDCSAVVTAQVDEIHALTEACPDFLDCSIDLSGIDVAICSMLEIPEGALTAMDQLALMAAAGFDLQSIVDIVHNGLATAMDQAIDTFYPNTMRMVTMPVTLGALTATLSTLYLAISYFPSVTSTTLQLRSGVIPLLHSKKLNVYRAGPDSVTTLTGALFWGCLFTGIIVGGLVSVISFFVLWQKSVAQTQKTLSIIIGIVVIAAIRTIIMTCGRSSYFTSFYRKKPAGANIYFLAMEWANFALSAGFVFVRMVQLLVAAAMNVGRIDSPFLAPGVGEIGPVDLDPFPTVHLRDILATEAHRHPYIELMGKVYLMKLKYGTKFVSNAGSCWRLLFVYALMPWMQKYRIFDTPAKLARIDAAKQDDDDDDQEAPEKKADSNGSSMVLHRSTSSSGESSKTTIIKSLKTENNALHRRIRELEGKVASMEEKMGKDGVPSSNSWFY